jgi:hypothetical protein
MSTHVLLVSVLHVAYYHYLMCIASLLLYMLCTTSCTRSDLAYALCDTPTAVHAGQAAIVGSGDAYKTAYKGASLCMSVLTTALSGGYVNFGVFALYGDKALDNALETVLKLALSVSDCHTIYCSVNIRFAVVTTATSVALQLCA